MCEPQDDIKGEIARALFYMAIRYDGVGCRLPQEAQRKEVVVHLAKSPGNAAGICGAGRSSAGSGRTHEVAIHMRVASIMVCACFLATSSYERGCPVVQASGEEKHCTIVKATDRINTHTHTHTINTNTRAYSHPRVEHFRVNPTFRVYVCNKLARH